MEGDDRKRRLESAKAKLANFKKKQRSKSKRSKQQGTQDSQSAADDALNSAKAGDSIAVQTGSYHSDRVLTLSEDSDVSTTADEISTEEEASYSGGLSPREKIQELELTISDQQIALQQLTIENKSLRDREAQLEDTIMARDSVIGELKDNVSQSASHVKSLQENLMSATESILSADGDQSEIVDQLVHTRQELKTYIESLKNQEEAMKELASKLAEKSIEAEEAHEKCRSLKAELDKTVQSQTLSSDETESAMMRLRSELEEQHGQQIALMKQEIDNARREVRILKEKEERRLLEEDSESEMDDLKAYQEQVQQLNLQLETAFRNTEKERNEHDKEVVKLNQNLISTIDKYESQLQAEKDLVADLEGRLDMADTVSSEIQASFSKQLQQLQEERENLRSKLREAEGAAIENAASAKIIENLDDQVTTYKAEVVETEKLLDKEKEANRKLQDEFEKLRKKIGTLGDVNNELSAKLQSSRDEIEKYQKEMASKDIEYEDLKIKFESDKEDLLVSHKDEMELLLHDAAQKAEEDTANAKALVHEEMEDKLKLAREEHADELKNLHSQHHKKMEEMKAEMETKMRVIKNSLDQEKKEQLGAVKEVHERSREREFNQLVQSHEDDLARLRRDHEEILETLQREHEKFVNKMKERYKEEKIVDDNRLRRDLEDEFEQKIEDLKQELAREKEREIAHLKEKHDGDLQKLQEQSASTNAESQREVSQIEEEFHKKMHDCVVKHKVEMEELKKGHETSKKSEAKQHAEAVEQLEADHHAKLEEMEAKMKRLLQEQREEQEAAIQLIKDEASAREETEKQIGQQMETLQYQLKDASSKLEEEYQQKITNIEAEHQQENQFLQEEVKKLQANVKDIQEERDDILKQAEESRKRLETLHHDEMLALRQELDSHIEGHKEKLEKMQLDVESANAAQGQLQELQEELDGWMEQVDLMKTDFSEKEKFMLVEHQRALDEIVEKHEYEKAELRHQLEENAACIEEAETIRDDLESQLEDYKLKLTAAQTNLASISASSPLRPVSSASEYDPANISAMKSDIRDALTITHISDVSGIGDELEEGTLHVTTDDDIIEGQLEEGDLPTLEEGELIETKESPIEDERNDDRSSSSSSSSSSEDGDENVSLETGHIESMEQGSEQTLDKPSSLEELENRIRHLEDELEKLSRSHKDEVHELVEKYKAQFTEREERIEAEKQTAVAEASAEHAAEIEELKKQHQEVVERLENDRQNQLTQLRLKCASDTASQIEEEITALRDQLDKSHKDEIESLKLDMEKTHTEKVEKLLQEKTDEKELELQKLSDEHTVSLEKKISALMAELYEQKLESLKKQEEEHKNEILSIEEGHEKATLAKEDEWIKKSNGLEEEIARLKLGMDNARLERQTLIESLESGENDYLKSLCKKHEIRIEKLKDESESKIQSQVAEYEKAQSEYIKQHQERLDKFLEERERDIQSVEEKKQAELSELQRKYEAQIEKLKSDFDNGKTSERRDIEQQFEEEKEKLIEEHRDEVRAVAIKLVEVRDERDQLLADKEGLLSQIQGLETEQEQSQAELKAALTAHHMEKFQAAITELDQHHLEEMEKLREEQEKETSQYKKVAEDLIEKMKSLEEEYRVGIQAVKDEKESELAAMQQVYDENLGDEKINHGSNITSMREAHEAQMRALQEEHESQLQLIEQEIANQNKSHRDALDEILQSQADKLKVLQKQFEIALAATKSEEQQKSEVLQERIVKLENELKVHQMKDSDSSSDSDSDDGKHEKEKNYLQQISELEELLECTKEDKQDLTAKIEFERAEYQAEIDQLQEEVATKDENLHELESELAKNKSALNSLKERFDTISSRREREGREEDNLLHMLRDDLDRLNDERDQLSSANQQLLSTLTKLVQSNHKCEDMISKKLQKMTAEQVSKDSMLSKTELSGDKSESDSSKSEGAAATDSEKTSSPGKLAQSGVSFEDEGLDLSQRLAESMFAGPELDTSARDVAVDSGTRMQQAVRQLVDAIQTTAQLNLIQQPQIVIGGEGDGNERVHQKHHTDEEDDTSSRSSESDHVGNVEDVLAECMNQQMEQEKRIQEQQEEATNLQSQIENYQSQNKSLQEENAVLQMQIDALTVGGDQAQQNLLQVNRELAAEKQALSDQFEASRIHAEKQILHLDTALEAETKKMEERENEHAAIVEDFETQIDALQKQMSSNSKFSAEQTTERELEREQFQEEINNLQDELGKRPLARSDSKLSEEVSRLEEELEARDNQISKLKEEKDKLKKTIQEYEENIQELRARGSEQSELDIVRDQLQDMAREREVIQQELYDNLLKVSALEAKLDQYKHTSEGTSIDPNNPTLLEQLQVKMDQEREENELKLAQLMEVQNQLRNGIIEKEEHIEKLLQELEGYRNLEAENAKLREDLVTKESIPSTSRVEEMEALSQQLLEAKNAEIDELQNKIQELEDGQSLSSESSEDDEESPLKEENLQLRSEIKEMESKLISKEDDHATPLDDMKAKIENLLKENDSLKTEILQMKDAVASQQSSLPLLGIPDDITEKISDLEDIIGNEPGDETQQDKLQQLEAELKSKPDTILGRILVAKDDEIDAKTQQLEETESALTKQNDNVTLLSEQVENLQRDLNEPDVKVRLKSKGEQSKNGHKEVDVEKESISSESDDCSSISSSDTERLSNTDNEVVQTMVATQEESPRVELDVSQIKKDAEMNVEDQLRALAAKQEECEQLTEKIAEMEAKCEELQMDLEQRNQEIESAKCDQTRVDALSEEEVLDLPSVQSALQKATASLEENLNKKQREIVAAKEEKDKLASALEDVQKEYLSLLRETQELQEIQDNQGLFQERIKELEGFLSQRQEQLQEAQKESDRLQDQVCQLQADLKVFNEEEREQNEKDSEIGQIKAALAEKEDNINELLDELKKKEEELAVLESQTKDSVQQSKALADEIELLQNEQQLLNAEKDHLQKETQDLKSKVVSLESAVIDKETELEHKVKELEVIKKERFIEPKSAMPFNRKEKVADQEKDSSTSSESGQEEVDGGASQQDLVQQHESKMEEMKQKYSQALTRVVEDTKRQMLEEHERNIRELQEKHKREMTEILQESFAGDSELARRLREELDIADQLDQNLMGHYASSSPRGADSNDEIPKKLQALLERVHNEGVQVLSLSELMFLRQHQKALRTTSTATVPPSTVEEAQQTSMRLEEDMAKLKDAYDGEKLALVDALQSLKNLVIQANPDLSGEDMPDGDDPRADIINAVAEVFEKEREILIAELQTSVVEAEIDARNTEEDGEMSTVKPAALKLEAMERKLKEQGAQQAAAIERLVTLDREPLLEEIAQLRDNQQALKQTEEKLAQLESQLNNNKASHNQNIFLLQSQVERLEYKLQQEKALAADVRSALESERVRTGDYIPALQRERDRSVELDNELGKLQRKLADDTKVTQDRTKALQAEVDEGRRQLHDVETKLSEAIENLRTAKNEAEQRQCELSETNSQNERTIRDLKHALTAEENRREQLVKSLDMERNNVAQLHEELATLRADSREEIEIQKIKLAEQEGKYTKERQKRKELATELEQQQKHNDGLRQALEEETQMAHVARQRDRDTVEELQRILDDARNETEVVQRKMDSAKEDAAMTKRHLEEVQFAHQESLDAEQSIRDRLESALEKAHDEKQELQSQIQSLGDELRRQKITNLVANTVPASHHTPEGLNMHRRQLESMRQRLQMESTKLQELLSKNAQRIPFTVNDSLNEPQEEARALASEMEQVDSVKRSLAEMQQELRGMYSTLSIPKRDRPSHIEQVDFSDHVMEQNAELVDLNTQHTDEKMALRDQLRKLEEEVWKARAGAEDTAEGTLDKRNQQNQVQEMANRIHRLYLRYLRAESFRKALVYQKKYLLLLIGGFQDCEEATLAVVAKMGAYPGGDAYGMYTHRSVAFKKFRSAARVVMAILRLRFLVKKSHRASDSVSSSIRERHGASPQAGGRHLSRSQKHDVPTESPNYRPHSSASGLGYPDKSPSPTPLPRYRTSSYERPYDGNDPYMQTLRAAPLYSGTPPTKLSPRFLHDPASIDARPKNSYTRSSTVPYLHSYGDRPSATAMRYLNGDDKPSASRPRSYHTEHKSPDTSSLSYSRAQPAESDPSLNEYIQKLENLQHRLEQNPHRFQR